MFNVIKFVFVEDKFNDVVVFRWCVVIVIDLDIFVDRFCVDMIYIFMFFLILKKRRLYFYGFNFILKNNVMGNVLEKKN